LFLYNLNCRPIPSGDTAPAALLPLRVVLCGRIDFDAWQPALARSYGGNAYFLRARNGHYYSAYPIAQPLLLTPLYAPLLAAPGLRDAPMPALVLLARALEKLMASLIAAASVAFLYLLLRHLTDPRRALLLAAVYAFATNVWSTSSQALWQHGAGQLAIVLSLLCLAVFQERAGWRAAAGAGLFAALSAAMRPSNVLFFAASCAALLCLHRRARLLAWYAGFGALIGGALALYNLRMFGLLRGGYFHPFTGAFWLGLAGLTVSPSHGLFVYSPVLLFALAGAFFCRRCGSLVFPVALLFCLADLAVYAKWPIWWGGDCYGPRLLAELSPVLVLLILPALDWVDRHRPLKAAFAASVVFSVAVQSIGAFAFPAGFQSPEPLWDWSRCPIVLNARQGPRLAPYRVAAGWANDLVHLRRPDIEHTGLRIR
jgi:MFS family permease